MLRTARLPWRRLGGGLLLPELLGASWWFDYVRSPRISLRAGTFITGNESLLGVAGSGPNGKALLSEAAPAKQPSLGTFGGVQCGVYDGIDDELHCQDAAVVAVGRTESWETYGVMYSNVAPGTLACFSVDGVVNKRIRSWPSTGMRAQLNNGAGNANISTTNITLPQKYVTRVLADAPGGNVLEVEVVGIGQAAGVFATTSPLYDIYSHGVSRDGAPHTFLDGGIFTELSFSGPLAASQKAAMFSFLAAWCS